MRGRFAAALTLAAPLSLALLACDLGRSLEIQEGMDGCASCGMVISEPRQAALFTVDKEHFPFCSVGCLLKEHESRRHAGVVAPDEIYFADYESGELLDSPTVVFALGVGVPTVMNWGILAFGDRDRAASFVEGEGRVVDWLGLRTLLGQVDRTVEVVVTPAGLEPAVVELEKGQLVEWIFHPVDLDGEMTLLLRGYEEMGQIPLWVSGEPVTRRMLALRPGDGFPLVAVDDDTVLGQVRIRGAHTADEAVP